MQTLSSDFFSLLYKKNTLSHNRYGLIIAKKIDRRAVVRNKLKRIIASSLQGIDPVLPQGYDMLIIVKKNFQQEEVIHIQQAILTLCKKII